MEKIVKVEMKQMNIVHKFYCDKCHKELGKSVEHSDGYYDTYGKFEEKMYIPVFGWVSVQGNLCNECRKEVQQAIRNKQQAIRDSIKDIANAFNLSFGETGC